MMLSLCMSIIVGLGTSCEAPPSLGGWLNRSTVPEIFDSTNCSDIERGSYPRGLSGYSVGFYIIDIFLGGPGYYHLQGELMKQGVCDIHGVGGLRLNPNFQNFSVYRDILSDKMAGYIEYHLRYRNMTFASIGLIGCYLSHAKTLSMAARAGHDLTFIFEDDTGFPQHPTFMDDVASNISMLPPDWDFFLLGHLPAPRFLTFYEDNSTSPIGRVSFYRGTQAYVVSSRGVCKALAYLTSSKINDHVDGVFSHMISKNLLNVYARKDSVVLANMLVKHLRNRKSVIFI